MKTITITVIELESHEVDVKIVYSASTDITKMEAVTADEALDALLKWIHGKGEGIMVDAHGTGCEKIVDQVFERLDREKKDQK